VSNQVFGNDWVERFKDRASVTIAAGITCAFLGDERNLREYLVADELVKALRNEGHIVHFLLFDDDMDPLNYRQLRVAVNKDQSIIDQFEPFCGKPISDIRSPFDDKLTWAKHFENQFLNRLSSLDCHPTLIRTSSLYSRGMYTPYVREVLLNKDTIIKYLEDTFAGYHPEKLYWPVCPTCGYIDCTHVASANETEVHIECERCGKASWIGYDELRGKLNWKFDCAARWSMFNIDVEPFTKSYLEPKSGSFVVAQGICKTFFGGGKVEPLHFGTVSMPKELGCRILPSLPASTLRNMFVKNYKADLDINEERIVVEASRAEVLPEYNFLSVIKQLLPAWLLDSTELTPVQRELLSKGMRFSKEFLHSEVRPVLPNGEKLESTPIDVLRAMHSLLQRIIVLRESFPNNYEAFIAPTKASIDKLGEQRKPVITHLRRLVGQEQGLPNSRFLFLLPISYLENLESMVSLYLAAKGRKETFAVIDPSALEVPFSLVNTERIAMDY